MGFRSNLKSTREWLQRLQQVKHDPDQLAALILESADAGAPGDAQAGIILGAHRHGDSQPILDALEHTLLHNPDWQARSAVTVTLAEMATHKAVDLLHLAENDRERKVRANARQSLKGLTNGSLPVTKRR